MNRLLGRIVIFVPETGEVFFKEEEDILELGEQDPLLDEDKVFQFKSPEEQAREENLLKKKRQGPTMADLQKKAQDLMGADAKASRATAGQVMKAKKAKAKAQKKQAAEASFLKQMEDIETKLKESLEEEEKAARSDPFYIPPNPNETPLKRTFDDQREEWEKKLPLMVKVLLLDQREEWERKHDRDVHRQKALASMRSKLRRESLESEGGSISLDDDELAALEEGDAFGDLQSPGAGSTVKSPERRLSTLGVLENSPLHPPMTKKLSAVEEQFIAGLEEREKNNKMRSLIRANSARVKSDDGAIRDSYSASGRSKSREEARPLLSQPAVLLGGGAASTSKDGERPESPIDLMKKRAKTPPKSPGMMKGQEERKAKGDVVTATRLLPKYRALYPFKPYGPGQLAVKKHDILYAVPDSKVAPPDAEGWMFLMLEADSSQCGYVPDTYILYLAAPKSAVTDSFYSVKVLEPGPVRRLAGVGAYHHLRKLPGVARKPYVGPAVDPRHGGYADGWLLEHLDGASEQVVQDSLFRRLLDVKGTAEERRETLRAALRDMDYDVGEFVEYYDENDEVFRAMIIDDDHLTPREGRGRGKHPQYATEWREAQWAPFTEVFAAAVSFDSFVLMDKKRAALNPEPEAVA